MNERKATVALLTVIAVLLALNLVVKGSREAEAQVRGADGEPYVVKWIYGTTGGGVGGYLRVWSDGQIDLWRYKSLSCDDLAFVQVTVAAVDHPHPVVDATWAGGSGFSNFMLEFADGRADAILRATGSGEETRCTIAGSGGVPFCIGDTDRSGVTDFQDIVNVLSDWGECN